MLLEAMAAGCPVVATEATGVQDIVRNGFNGTMSTGNIEEWVQAVRGTFESPNLEEIKKHASATAREYTQGQVTFKLL